MKRKNIFKSLLGAAMALIMIFGAAPLSGFVGIRLPMLSLKAEAAITGTTEDGLFEYEVGKHETDSGYQYGVTITRYKGPDSGEVVIPKIIAGYEVKWIGYAAFLDCIGITSIVIPDGVMTIAMGAFLRCKGIKSVVFPESMTGICDSAFAGCTNLKEVIIPNVTYIDKSAFSGCTSLSKVEFSDRLEVIDERAFSNCNSLKSIIIPKNTIGICEYAFANCTSLEKIEIKSGATTIYEKAFDGCVNLKELTIRSYVEEEDIKRFSSCTNLESITVDSVSESDGDPWWIWFCSRLPKLANINILSNDKKYSSIDGVLCNKDGSELLLYPKGNKRSTYTVPDGVTKINYEAFSGCTSMKSITIGSGVEELDDSFISFCRRLANINVSPNNKNYSSIDGVLFNKDGSKLLAYPRGNERSKYTIPDGVTTICKNAFLGCYIKTLTIPVSVTEIESNAFGNKYYSFYNTINDIYYLGTREQWKEVVVGENNSVITRARLHCADDPPCNHSWSAWEVVEEATYEKDGLERRVCSLCNIEETRSIPKLVRVSAIELSESEKTVFVGDTFTITATVKPDNAWNRTVTWSSSDPSIATVDENGTVTAIAEGEAIITAESADGVKAECKVTVEKKDGFFKTLLKIITAPFRAIIYLFKKLFGK